MLIDPAFVIGAFPAVVGLALFIVLAKALATVAAVFPFRLGSKTTVFTSPGMLQIGEFSYILARAGRDAGAISETLNNLILTSSVLTIVVTPAAFLVAPRVALLLEGAPFIGSLLRVRSAVLADGQMLEDHAVVIGYGRVGSRVVAGLRDVGLPVVVVEEDLHLVQRIRHEGIPAIYGDASHATILSSARPERARLFVVALPDVGATRIVVGNARRANLTVPILARAAREEEGKTLRGLGATAVVSPEQAGASVLLEEIMEALDLDHMVTLDSVTRESSRR